MVNTARACVSGLDGFAAIQAARHADHHRRRSERSMLGVSLPTAIQSIDRLVRGGQSAPFEHEKAAKVFETRDIINIFTSLERQLATPTGERVSR